MVCWTMSSLYKYIIIRSVNAHKHRVGGKDMYPFSSFLWLSVGNTLRLSPIVWSKENMGSLQVFQEAIDPLPFVLTCGQVSFFPFCFGDEKTRKKHYRRFFCFYVVVFIVVFFLREYNWERFLSMFTRRQKLCGSTSRKTPTNKHML